MDKTRRVDLVRVTAKPVSSPVASAGPAGSAGTFCSRPVTLDIISFVVAVAL